MLPYILMDSVLVRSEIVGVDDGFDPYALQCTVHDMFSLVSPPLSNLILMENPSWFVVVRYFSNEGEEILVACSCSWEWLVSIGSYFSHEVMHITAAAIR